MNRVTIIKLLLGLIPPMGRRATLFGLDSVQNSVAILNHRQLVAQAPIEQLSAGSSGVVYSLTVRGDGQAAQQALLAEPWVTAEGRC